jgi:hypothetical protein
MRSRRFVPGAASALLAPALLVLAFLAPADPVEAQSHRSAVTLLGGMSNNSDLAAGLDFQTELQSGGVAGIQAERWLGSGRTGLRARALATMTSMAEQEAADPGFYITTPIYYVNDKPHIGHAYTTVASDAFARFNRLDGKRVRLLTGTDEHGQKVEQSAENRGLAPLDFADGVSANFRSLAATLLCTNDDFVRTTEPRHKETVLLLWRELVARGHIYKGAYEGWYSVRDESFYTEAELVDGKAPTGAEVAWVSEPSYFFRLSAFTEPLLQLYRERDGFILPTSRKNEMLRFVEGGLQDLSISRTAFSWGIPVPDDEEHVIYVWLDALTNYLTVPPRPRPPAPPRRAAAPTARRGDAGSDGEKGSCGAAAAAAREAIEAHCGRGQGGAGRGCGQGGAGRG